MAGVRRSDTVSRHGGDEFVVLLTQVTSAGDARLGADNLCAAIAAPHRIEGSDLYLTASAGVGVYPADGTDAESLLKRADLELLHAKARRHAMRGATDSARIGAAPYRPLAAKPADSAHGLRPETTGQRARARGRDRTFTHSKENQMNWDRIEGNWKQVTGKAKVQWGKLTDDDLDVVAGRREQLSGKIQERYGVAKDEAEKQVTAWESKADDSWFS